MFNPSESISQASFCQECLKNQRFLGPSKDIHGDFFDQDKKNQYCLKIINLQFTCVKNALKGVACQHYLKNKYYTV